MEWLNFHHLFYFWRIAREGGLSRAAEQLRLTHSTLSTQLRALEDFLGGALFDRRGRRLVLTPLGEDVAAYADDIFKLGSELVDVARGKSSSRRSALRVGIVSHLPKTVVYRLLTPAIETSGYGPLVARQGELEPLLEELVANRVHVVLADSPPPESHGARVFAHLLGESPMLLYGSTEDARRYRRGFPQSLDDARVLLPTARSSLRRQLDRWFADHGVRVRVEGEFDDAALMRVAGIHGLGLFPVRAALRAEVEDTHSAKLIGPLEGVVERYYVVSREHRIRHPAVGALVENARADLAYPEQPRRVRSRKRTSKRPPV